MLPSAIRAGLSIPEFWDLTYEEISIYVDAKNEEKFDELRYHAGLIHTLGGLVGMAAWSDKPYPQITEVFPELFEAEETKEEQELLVARLERDKWIAFAEGFNAKRKEVQT